MFCSSAQQTKEESFQETSTAAVTGCSWEDPCSSGQEKFDPHKEPVVCSELGKTSPETPHVLWQTRSHNHHAGHAGHEDLVPFCEDL